LTRGQLWQRRIVAITTSSSSKPSSWRAGV